MEVMVLGYWAK